MQFTFSEEQMLAAQSLRKLLLDYCSTASLRRTADDPDGQTALSETALRRTRLNSLGLAGALVPEEQGGLGLAAIDLVLLAEEAGRAALPEPLIEQVGNANALLARLSKDISLLRPIMAQVLAGEASVICLPPGTKYIVGVGLADFIITSHTDTKLSIFDLLKVSVTNRESIDPLRKLSIVSTNDVSPIAKIQGDVAVAQWEIARARGAVFGAAELLGLAQRMVEIAVTYSLERKQFGKVIGSNQALKHHLANAQIKIEFARPVVYAAAAALGALGVPSRQTLVRVSHAFIAAGDAADFAARTAIQVHGAMGYSWEIDLQFFAKRAWALIACHGGRSYHGKRIHAAMLDTTFLAGPEKLFEVA